jgi:response regulator RpfG family c-di-GMP phosphodiesterase
MPKKQPSNRILFVDDEETVLSGFRLTIGRDHDVSVASSGPKGIEVFKNDGPFAVVVSDFQMPGMNGAEFLKTIRSMDSEVVTMLLTGAANFEDVSTTVRCGRIFRLLGKPCPTEEMRENLCDALEQYRLVRAEQDLLEETLNGAVSAMTAILAASKPLFFGRSQRVKRMAFQLADEMDISDSWRLELAATFSYLGFVGLPDEVQEDVYHHKVLSNEVQNILNGFPVFISDVLGEIPRLDEIARIILHIDDDFNENTPDEKGIRKLASLLRLSQHYDRYLTEGHAGTRIFETLMQREQIYLPGAVASLRKIYDLDRDDTQIEEVSPDCLEPGMQVSEDLRLPNGLLVAPRGTVVDHHFVRIIQNYMATYARNPFPERVVALVKVNQPPGSDSSLPPL